MTRLAALLIGLGAAGPESGGAQDRPTYFYSDGVRVPITLATDRIAVRLPSGDSVSTAARAARFLALPQAPFTRNTRSVRVMVNEGIAIIPLVSPQNRESIRRASELLRSQDGVLEVGHVVVTAAGVEMVMTDEVVAAFRPTVSREAVAAALDREGLEAVTAAVPETRWRLLRLRPGATPTNAADVANRLVESGLVEFAHPNFIVETRTRLTRLSATRSPDPLQPRQWHLDSRGNSTVARGADMAVVKAWTVTAGRPEVTIAILDDGIERRHPDLTGNIGTGLDLVATPEDDDPSPTSSQESHGTPVTGLAAASAGNGIAGAGVCPKCTILPIRMLGGSIATHAAAIDRAVTAGAAIISNSWGYAQSVPLFDVVRRAIHRATTEGRGAKGAAVLFAAPNEDADFCAGRDIAAVPGVISVSGINSRNLPTPFGWGPCLDVVAPTHSARQPGTVAIVTTAIGLGVTEGFGGTSAATPMVAGAIGLLLSLEPGLSLDQIRERLRRTADKVPNPDGYDGGGFSRRLGFGKVNAYRLVTEH